MKMGEGGGQWLLLGVALLLSLGFVGSARARPRVYFAGFALRGAAATSRSRYPYTSALLAHLRASHTSIGRRIDGALSGFHSPNFILRRSRLGHIGSGQSIAVAFVLNRETVGQGRIGGTYKLYIQLSGSVLFFDFHQMSVIASFPVSVEYLDAFDSPITHAEIAEDVRELYVGHLQVNLLKQYVETLKAAKIKAAYGNHIRIRRVTIRADALSDMAPEFRRNPSDARAFVAETFGQALVANQHVALLPYRKDQAIGNKMALRFANGDVFNLSIPQSDYDLAITVRRFLRVAYEHQSYATGWIYAAYVSLRLYEPLSGHVYLDAPFRDGVFKIIPSNQTRVMNWPVYQEALLRLFVKITRAVSHPGSTWATQASGEPDIRQALARTAIVMKSCR